MNNATLLKLFNNDVQLNTSNIDALDKVLSDYPYFQAARAVQLKGLHLKDSYKYNKALKKTAAYTIDRKLLFEYITSQFFVNLGTSENSAEVVKNIDVIDEETIQELHKKITDNLPILDGTIETVEEKQELIEDQAEEILEIGKPLDFKSSEPHSFNEWMQLISKEPISRKFTDDTKSKKNKFDDKNEIVDRFIKTNPKIKPVDKSLQNKDISLSSLEENESLMTETLAKVYLEQRKFNNAIKAYRILSLKYPEKSGFFADRIKAIKILQKHKS